jgi:hypothetical protein
MVQHIDQHLQAVRDSNFCSTAFAHARAAFAHARESLVTAQKETGIPYTELCTCGRSKVCLGCIISRLREDWHLVGPQPDSYEDWEDLACNVMDILGEEQARPAESHIGCAVGH